MPRPINALPEGRTYTIAVYIATLLFVLAFAVLIFGAFTSQIGAAIGTMNAFAGALGVVAGAYGAKATAQHYKGGVRGETECNEPA